MTQWEYCEVDFDGAVTWIYFYDEAGTYIDSPKKHARLGLTLAKLGHEGWEIISCWWRNDKKVTYMLKRPCQQVWTPEQSEQAKQDYWKNFPRDARL